MKLNYGNQNKRGKNGRNRTYDSDNRDSCNTDMVRMKYPCQGPNCHTYATKDRFNKSSKRLKGRNAYHNIDMNGVYSIFCTTGCQNDWINNNVANIVNQRPVTFNRERKFSEHIYHLNESGWVQKISDGVDNEQIIG